MERIWNPDLLFEKFDCRPEASEGYTKETKQHKLSVDFLQKLLEIYPEEQRAAILGILSEDPKPAYVRWNISKERIF